MGMVIAVILAIVTVLAIEGAIVMFLWNYLSPEIIPTGDMSFLQAVALVVLTSLLFGNIAKPNTDRAKKLDAGQKASK